MNYSSFITNDDFGEQKKLAADLAFALDHPVADCADKEYGIPIEERTKIFNALCALCEKCGLAVPPLEDCIRKNGLLQSKKEISRSTTVILAQSKEVLSTLPEEMRDEFSRLIHAMEVISNLESYSGVSSFNIYALMNRLLVEKAERDPIRPDYAAIKLPQHPESIALDSPTKVVIVDDSPSDILKSHFAASGIAQMELAWIKQENEWFGDYEDENEKKAQIEKLAAAIQAEEPQIVLMDQGLKRLKGSEVVHHMRRELSSQILFVANTGGMADELLEAGCVGFENYNKGERPQALYYALINK